MTKFIYASDAGHGWIGVPESLLIELNIDHAISDFSYYDRQPSGSTVWVEEDGDAMLFVEAYRARFRKEPEFIDRNDGCSSPIRNLRAWRGTGLSWKAQFAMIEGFRAQQSAA